ncbi:hypothetical protein PC41400_19220 [Paenibacillus chitinolyticus]|uniref:Rad50/SbcC-type AAA domain-containing protein n=1 Tax=Paenibacillus chitinolyticus TaxID=79263 RepID=A0A410WZA1_9BACL|nr:hypothetical protein [Paenibacillus chitinolyticus]MCY9590328.1 hypothetical protein [Paenibacillus chitinolyticus]MCY9597024.1 hypothetical protein [Paenibacillus chitinolyticus]QAV19680.1 hypothetical protein PC41400_19220 [Paenibacillus chitinolyticus]
MTTKGFFLTKLCLLGKNELMTEIEFKKGLNVIMGPTNTGKSFLFECINFMLGGKDAPEQIDEIVDYEYHTIFLELESNDGLKFTFERQLSGGNFKKYNCPIHELTTESKFQNLSQKHSEKKESMSKFLMSLTGYKNTNLFIKTNKNNKLRRFTYRNYNDFILIDEVKIIAKESPVHSDNNKTKTAEEAAFRLILTNKDDSELSENVVASNSGSVYTAQVGLIDRLINDLELNISNLTPLQSEVDLDAIIKGLTLKRSGISSEIEKLTDSRKKLWKNIQQDESKLLSTYELLKRFLLLKDQYETDMQRINFLIEGDHFFSLLNYEKCPHCNQTLTLNNGELACSHLEIEQKKESYKIELQKLLFHLEDLNSTIESMNEEVSSINTKLVDDKEDYNKLSKVLDEQLEPEILIIEEELQGILKNQKTINEVEQKKHTLNKLLDEKRNILDLIGSEPDTGATSEQLLDYTKFYDDLCESIKYFLTGWKYPGFESVKFDVKQKDILISGKARRLFGKGYRSISYSAFVLGVMKYCNLKDLPHPGIVILDSPITSYKEEDGDEDKTSDDLQSRFFEFLAEVTLNNQVIILENKKPSEEVIKEINFIEFTKSHSRGRYGFIRTSN